MRRIFFLNNCEELCSKVHIKLLCVIKAVLVQCTVHSSNQIATRNCRDRRLRSDFITVFMDQSYKSESNWISSAQVFILKNISNRIERKCLCNKIVFCYTFFCLPFSFSNCCFMIALNILISFQIGRIILIVGSTICGSRQIDRNFLFQKFTLKFLS